MGAGVSKEARVLPCQASRRGEHPESEIVQVVLVLLPLLQNMVHSLGHSVKD